MIPVRLKYEVEAGPDLIPSRSGVRTLRSAGLYRYQHVEVDSLSLSLREYAASDAESSIITHSVFTFTFCL